MLYRQDHKGSSAANKIQRMWRGYKNMVYVHEDPLVEMEPFTLVEPPFMNTPEYGAFHYGYHSHVCATKIQALVRGHQDRVKVPMERMCRWILDNLINSTEV